METLTNRARRLVRTMSLEEREAILDLFNEYIGPTDPVWQMPPTWSVPAPELYMALMADRGY